jgi:murein DD-endopeptidase MepM/ murein hydrolase activator NlpD
MPVLLALLLFALAPPPPAYVSPVPGPVVEAFRPPQCPWCPGNRGIDYAPTPGTGVVASAAGVVSFAGQVGGTLVVVVAHPDGLRTTYADVAGIDVRAGQPVAQGQQVGRSGPHLHFGVRRGTVYLDPAALLRAPHWRPHLIAMGRRGP